MSFVNFSFTKILDVERGAPIHIKALNRNSSSIGEFEKLHSALTQHKQFRNQSRSELSLRKQERFQKSTIKIA